MLRLWYRWRCGRFCATALHSGNQGGGETQEHAEEGAPDMEPVVVVGGGHVLSAGDDEMLVVVRA